MPLNALDPPRTFLLRYIGGNEEERSSAWPVDQIGSADAAAGRRRAPDVAMTPRTCFTSMDHAPDPDRRLDRPLFFRSIANKY